MRSKDDLPNTEVLIGKIMDENKSRAVNTAVDNNALYAGNRQSSNQRRNNPKQKKSYPCYICGSLEHWASKCPQRPKGTVKNVSANFENLYVEVASTEEVNNVTSTSRWCLDSGCTTHMCANEEMMEDLQKCTATLNMANTALTTAKAKGTASRNVEQMDLEYMHPEEDTEPRRETRNERVHQEPEMGPPKRAPGRPAKQKSGKLGRPKKLYRYVSMSSVASSNASSHEGDVDEPMEQEADGPDDVFYQASEENRGEKRPLDTSLVQIDKRARSEMGGSGAGTLTNDVEDLEDEDEPIERQSHVRGGGGPDKSH
ncbi:Protein of unknown function [Cotesia congregata]|uniref:CCHC-type domain-containing protein n=1 Tax=Cotesia congregata TaxID=51543 RepID=A0A8J2GZE6_COTCN|nr:Protein of unknown function [Cotesia congregata]